MHLPKIVAENLEKIGGLVEVRDHIPRGSRISLLSAVFQSLSDPVRLSILYALSVTPLCVCVIKSAVKIADSKLSYHLDNLRLAGLVVRQHEGKFIVYKITDTGRILLSICENVM